MKKTIAIIKKNGSCLFVGEVKYVESADYEQLRMESRHFEMESVKEKNALIKEIKDLKKDIEELKSEIKLLKGEE